MNQNFLIAFSCLSLMAAACATTEAAESEAAKAEASTAYEPMAPFAKFAGKTLRGEGTGPDGAPLVDIAKWEYILGGRALQSTHRLEGGDYGGRTIFFYDESAKTYVFHYFTTAGFHTTGEATTTDTGFRAKETVMGHPTIAEVHSEMIFDGDVIRVMSSYVSKDGKATEPEEKFVYREIEDPGPLFND